MTRTFDLVVVGAGPGGMSAATVAREHAVDVLVLDEQSAPGGQIYRNIEAVTAQRANATRILGEDYAAGAAIARAFRASGARYEPGTSVWEINTVARRADSRAPFDIGILRDGVAEMIAARCIIAATGAQERAVTVPGATLPGVMGAGGAQSLLKSSGLVPDLPTVIAGSGPLVYLIAYQLVRAGAPVRAVLLTTPPDRIWRSVGTLPEALACPSLLRKGIEWRRALSGWGVPVMHVRDLAIDGDGRAERVRFTRRGRERELDASIVLLHEGVIPSVHLSMAAGLDHVWDDRQHGFRPVVDAWGETSVRGVFVAGDGARILGAQAAVDTARLAALQAAFRLERIDSDRRHHLAARPRESLARHRRFREFLDLSFEPAGAMLRPSNPEVMVCRCEEVTAGDLARIAAAGCPGPNQAKAYTRCGMGPCQGRMCAVAVSEIFAEQRHDDVARVGHYRIRPPVKPLTVGELSGLEGTGTAPADRAATPIRPKSAA